VFRDRQRQQYAQPRRLWRSHLQHLVGVQVLSYSIVHLEENTRAVGAIGLCEARNRTPVLSAFGLLSAFLGTACLDQGLERETDLVDEDDLDRTHADDKVDDFQRITEIAISVSAI
jgi:hypothetical protein